MDTCTKTGFTAREIVNEMVALSPDHDLQRSLLLTQELARRRLEASADASERARFDAVAKRGIAGFDPARLPRWRRILVTGGTGCVGATVLNQLQSDLPSAEVLSVARRAVAPERAAVGVTYLSADVRRPDSIAHVMGEVCPDLVIHLAAQRNPALAEEQIYQTVSTNVLGTRVVLEAAQRAGVETVAIATTGKTVRLFTSDVYAATKKLVEHEAMRAALRYGMRIACARFTHVVDNSIVRSNIDRWIAEGAPIHLHAPDVLLPVQSALESYQLLMCGAAVARPGVATAAAIRDLGWPPISLLDLALDRLGEEMPIRSPIVFPGYPSGYESHVYPGTYDPRTAGEVSPLINVIEAAVTRPAPLFGDNVDEFDLADLLNGSSRDQVERSITSLLGAVRTETEPEAHLTHLLKVASGSQLDSVLSGLSADTLGRIRRLGSSYDQRVPDHHHIHKAVVRQWRRTAAAAEGLPVTDCSELATLAVVIPTRNEADNVPALLAELRKVLRGKDGCEIIFVDDSTDTTPEVIREQAERCPVPIRLITRDGAEGGLAGAVLRGLGSTEATWVVVMDGDLQHPPAVVDRLYERMAVGDCDLVVASRYLADSAAVGLESPWRKMVSRCATGVARSMFSRHLSGCTDPMSGFFMLRRAAIALDDVTASGYKILLSLLVHRQMRVAEIPYHFRPRFAGTSKATLAEGTRFLRLLIDLRNPSPLHSLSTVTVALPDSLGVQPSLATHTGSDVILANASGDNG